MAFIDKWLEVVDRKNSVLCAGFDPAEFEMGRGEKGLPRFANKRDWSFDYIEAVALDCAAIKPNINYLQNLGDMTILTDITKFAHSRNLVVILDNKSADMGSSNDAGFYYAKKKSIDAITFSSFAGNMREVAEQTKKREIGIISMCLMSNPEYEREKNKLVSIDKNEYDAKDIIYVSEEPHVKQYIQLANDAYHYGIESILIGAPSSNNHITEEEIDTVRGYVSDDMLVLMPGVGAQGGEADIIWKYFDKNNVIVNVGRDLMFPKGSKSTSEDHRNVARYYKEKLNELRNGKI